MAFPWIFESNFEAGTNAEWDSETDTEGALNIRHYSFLSSLGVTEVGPIAPYRGAYVAEWNLLGDTADHTLIEGDMDIADTATAWSRFYLFLGNDLRGTTDIFNIFELQGTANAVEGAVSLRVTTGASVVEIGIGQTAASVFATQPLLRGKWYCIETKHVVQTGGTGTIDLYVDGGLAQSVTTLTNTAVLRGVLGSQNTLSTTLGHFYIDQFVFDDTQIYPINVRYPDTLTITKSSHIFLGSGVIDNMTLLSGAGTDCVAEIYDTDTANSTNASALKGRLANTANGETVDLPGVPIEVQRGCFILISGTTPRVTITLNRAQGYSSAGRVRQYGTNRNSSAQSVS